MKTTSIILAVGALLLVGILAWGYSNWRTYAPDVYITETSSEGQNGTSTQVSTIDTNNNTITPGFPVFTLTEVALHNKADDCYTVINGAVYNLTMWVKMHPGGQPPILSLCGVDGTAKFIAKHGSSEKPNTALARFKIGLLAR